MTPKVSIRRALTDPALLGDVLGDATWATWRTLLIAAMGEPLSEAEAETFNRITGGRTAQPGVMVEELLGVIGRRGGKTRAMAALGVYLAELCDHRDRLVKGETGTVLLIAPDQKQARIARDYAEGIMEDSPVLRHAIAHRTADTLELASGIVIEVRAASFRRLRGVTCVAVLADESCFFYNDEGSANADAEILNAVRPTLATTGGLLAIISSPHAKRGETYETWRRHFGPEGDPRILVAQGASRDFNPSLPQSVVDRALERDHAAASAEYLAIWRDDIAAFVSIEVVEGCVDAGVFERPPVASTQYLAHTDPSGGSSDSWTLAIGHRDGDAVVLDLVREWRAPFSPENVAGEIADLLKAYGIARVCGDRYAGIFPRELMSKRGIDYIVADMTASDYYLNFLPLLNSGRARLLDNRRLVSQIARLERRTSRGGRDLISHPPGAHDDVANAVAGALVLAARPAMVRPSAIVGSYQLVNDDYARRHRRRVFG